MHSVMYGVHQSDSLRVEAAPEPSSSGLHALQPLTRGEGCKQSMGQVGWVPHDAGRTAPAPPDVDVLNGWKTAAGDLLGNFHHPLQRLPIGSRAVSIPSGDGEGRTYRKLPALR